MESTPFFLGNQFLQGKEESMDKGTFTLGNIILNRYPVLSTLTHQATEPGRVQQNFQQLEMESSDMEALPCFNSTMLRQTHRWKLPERDPEQTQSKMEKVQQSHPVE